MKNFHYDEANGIVYILPDRDDSKGFFLGELSTQDFAKLRTTFATQAFFDHHKINVSGLNIRVIHGPSKSH